MKPGNTTVALKMRAWSYQNHEIITHLLSSKRHHGGLIVYEYVVIWE